MVKKSQESFLKKNLKIKISTLMCYKSHIIQGFKLGYDFDKNYKEGILHLKNAILYKKRKDLTKIRGG